MLLFSDQIRTLLDVYQAKGINISTSRAYDAVNQAYRHIASMARWSYLHRRTQINTVAPYSTGTVAFTASTRTLTLTSGSWPTWAGSGLLLIAGQVYAVERMVSSTILTLVADRCPVSDVAALTTYTIFRVEYLLPADFIRTEELVPIGQWWNMYERQPGSILQTSRLFSRPSRPFEFVVRGSMQSQGRMAMEFGPPPDAAYTLDLTYFAKPRQRTLPAAYRAGTISVSGTTVTGVNTAFTPAMVGCRLRVGTTAAAPVGESGDLGSLTESTVVAVTSSTVLIVADSLPTVNDVQFIVDDPVDIDRQSMDELFCRLCEQQFEILGNFNDRSTKDAEVRAVFLTARASDVRLSPHQQSYANSGPSADAMIYSGLNHNH